MNSHKKCTYTLPKAVISTVEKNSSISMSRWLSESIQNGYEMMIDGYYDNGKQPLVGIKRRRNGTIPKTFSIPIKVDDTLRWFSETLNVRTSHLVVVCVLNYNHRNSEGTPLRIEELLRMMDEIY